VSKFHAAKFGGPHEREGEKGAPLKRYFTVIGSFSVKMVANRAAQTCCLS